MPKNYDTTLARIAGNLLSGQPMALRKKHRKKLAHQAVLMAVAIREEAIEADKDKSDQKADE